MQGRERVRALSIRRPQPHIQWNHKFSSILGKYERSCILKRAWWNVYIIIIFFTFYKKKEFLLAAQMFGFCLTRCSLRWEIKIIKQTGATLKRHTLRHWPRCQNWYKAIKNISCILLLNLHYLYFGYQYKKKYSHQGFFLWPSNPWSIRG